MGNNNKSKGVYGKYFIEKQDGSLIDPDACYFVLRLDTDAAARKAMRVYMAECGNRQLQSDVCACLDELEATPEPMYSRVWRQGESQ